MMNDSIRKSRLGDSRIIDIKSTDNENIPIIADERGKTHYGGDQMWFSRYVRRVGGCGPVAAANVFASYAKRDKNIAIKLGHEDWFGQPSIKKSEFLAFMDEVYETVKPREINANAKGLSLIPPTMGMTNFDNYVKKVLLFAENKDISIKTASLKSPVSDKDIFLSYIKSRLKKNAPIILLTGMDSHAFYKKDASPARDYRGNVMYNAAHYVVITKIDKAEKWLTVSSYGKEFFIDIDDVYKKWALKFRPSRAIIRSAMLSLDFD